MLELVTIVPSMLELVTVVRQPPTVVNSDTNQRRLVHSDSQS